jgi:hypothetical protein
MLLQSKVQQIMCNMPKEYWISLPVLCKTMNESIQIVDIVSIFNIPQILHILFVRTFPFGNSAFLNGNRRDIHMNNTRAMACLERMLILVQNRDLSDCPLWASVNPHTKGVGGYWSVFAGIFTFVGFNTP